MKKDIYQRVTDRIVSELEKGVRLWLKPWNPEHAAGRITRPLRANGIPYRGINIIMLWSEALARGYSAPIWLTLKQALELGAHVRKNYASLGVRYAAFLFGMRANVRATAHWRMRDATVIAIQPCPRSMSVHTPAAPASLQCSELAKSATSRLRS
jgi:antirestriction protein ArdC